MQFKTIIFNFEKGIARITLNRPASNNSINMDMAKDLCNVAMHCSENRAVRVILITGAGRIFCPGGDVKGFAAEGQNMPDHLKELSTYLHLAVSRFTRTEAPVVVAVNGVAAGAGMSLACSGDIVLAAESARFVMAYAGIGLSPDGGATYFLPRIVGLKRAIDMAITNRQVSAKEAFDLGIVTRVVQDADLLSEAESVARQLASGATRAFGAVKRLMHEGFTETLETQLESESQSIVSMARTSDAQEAVSAFLEKRAPKLTGQ